MKPNRIAMTVDSSGLRQGVPAISKTEDAIRDAVERAINEGWDARRFRSEVAEAWVERLKQDAADARKILEGPA